MKFAAIADWADSDSYPVAFMCRELGVSRSGYYAWRSRPPSQRALDDATVIAIMEQIFAEARGNPGVRRMRAGLAAVGYRLSGKRVWRLMKAAGLRGHHVRRSLGRTGICYDNAVSESFFATYKKELIHTRPWPTITDLKEKTKDWVDNYYNVKRRHSYLEYLTPTEFELGFRHLNQLAA